MFETLGQVKWEYMLDLKAMASLITAITALTAACLLSYDMFVGRKRIPRDWWYAPVLAAIVFWALTLFAGLRFVDALHDLAFLAANPEAITTLSQEFRFMDIALLGVGINTFVFTLVYGYIYTRLPKQP